jgi:hypothetical protein
VGRGAAQGGSGLRLMAALAAGSMVAGAYAPWGTVTAAVLGSGSPVLAVKGTRIGFGVGVVPWGWIVLAAGVVGAAGILGDATLAIAAGFSGAVAAAANAALLGHADRLVPGLLDDVLQPSVALAWGAVFALAASLVLLVASATLRNRRALVGGY